MMKKYKFFGLQISFFSLMGLIFVSSCSPKKSDTPLSQASAEVPITIGVQPNESAKDLSELQSVLSQKMNRKIEFYKPTDYGQLVEAFSQKKIEFAFMTGLVFIEAEKTSEAKALLKKVYGKNEFYYSAIIVNSKSKFRKLSDLKGKKFGFVDPKSTSGYLYPRVMLRKSGLDAGEGLIPSEKVLSSEFFGTHEKAVAALVEGKVDAVSVWSDEPSEKTGAWTEDNFKQNPEIQFRVIEYSDPIPNDVFAVRESYYKEHAMVVFKLMETLIGLSEESGNVLKKSLDVERLTTATSRHYDSVRALKELIKETGK